MIIDNSVDLPDGWILTTLGDLGSWSSGGTPSRTESKYYNGDIPWIKTGDLSDGLLLKIEENITEEGLKNSSAKIFPINSLVVAMYGATIGRLGILKIPAATNQACGVLLAQGTTDRLIQYLFYYLLGSREILRKIGKGGAQPNISQTLLKEFPCPLPPLNEQRRIVSTIEQLTDRSNRARAALADVTKLIEQFRQSVLAAAFRGDLTADWREKNPDVEPASELLERIKIDRRNRWEEAELEKMKAQGKEPKDDKWKERYKEPNSCDLDSLPTIPDSWVWSSTEELSEVETGATPKRGEGKYYENGSIAWVTSGALNELFIDKADEYITEIALQETNAKVFPVHTLLIAMYGEGQTRGRVSELLIEAATNQACAALVFKGLSLDIQPVIKLFFQKYYEEIRMLASGGVQPNLNLSIVKSIAIPIPPIEEQKEIFRVVNRCMSTLQSLDRENIQATDSLDFLDRSILAKAFRGELVPQDPNDEPAAVLLERIRAEREQTTTHKQRGKTTRKISSKQLSIKGIK